jgi:hypothetical protein
MADVTPFLRLLYALWRHAESMASLNALAEAESLVGELEDARRIRRLLTMRFAAIALATLALASLHVIPWLAGGTAIILWCLVVGSARLAERQVLNRVMRLPVIRLLRQSGSQPTAQ